MLRCLSLLGCPEDKLHVHHLGVSVDEIQYEPRSWNDRTPLRILIAATFREKKGVPYALAALGTLKGKVDLEVTIIGDATEEPRSQIEKTRIISEIEQQGLSSNVRMLGFRSHRELMAEAYGHHIFLSPSITASDGDTEGGAPVTIIELAASGMPVVTTRHCDIPNVLPTDAELAEERDVHGLVRILSRWIESRGNWDATLLRARKRVEAEFDVTKQSQKLADIYADLA
jgi:colanic acid/amylovoran biosynthesis glycosyltransferase